MPLRASAIESTVSVLPELARIEYESGKLTIRAYVGGRQVALVHFESVEGFRVLDEGDLLEFWPTCCWSRGKWLWEVHEGGWLELESTRAGFVGERYKEAAEYLLVGANECVSVISHDRPVVTEGAL